MNTRSFKSNTSQIPTYLDGYFSLFKIRTDTEPYPSEYLEKAEGNFPFEYRTIGDRLRLEARQRDIEITHKVRIPQTKEITALHVLRFGEEYMQVHNTQNFTNNDGFKQTEITLKTYDKKVVIHDKKE